MNIQSFDKWHFFHYIPLVIFGFILGELIIIIATPPSRGYELSVYSAYPVFFWVLFFLSLLLSTLLFFYSFFHKNEKIWIYGIVAILLNYTIFLFLPTIRGYYIFAQGHDDVFAHLGLINEIQVDGFMYRDDYYPSSHILSACLSELGIPSNFLANFFPAVFSLFFIIFFYIIGRSLIQDTKFRLILLIVSTPLLFSFFHQTFHPFMFSIFMIPLIIFCVYSIKQTYRIEYSIVLCILIAALVFMHPLTGILSILILVIYCLFYLVIGDPRQMHFRNTMLLLSFFGCVILITWLLSLDPLTYLADKFFTALFDATPEKTTIITAYSKEVATSEADIWLIVSTFIKSYGPTIVYLSLAMICAGLYVYWIYQRKIDRSKSLFVILFFTAMLFAVIIVGVSSIIFEPIRAVAFAVITGMILIAVCYYDLMAQTRYTKYHKYIMYSLFFIVGFSIVLGALNVYDSPWVSKASKQMSYMEKNGIDWLISNRMANQPILLNSNRYRKYELLYFGIPEGYGKQGSYMLDDIPTHFGYLDNAEFGSLFEFDYIAYMVTNEYMNQLPYAVSDERRWRLKQYTQDDLFRLNNDATVDRIYANNEYNVWVVHHR